MLDGALRYPTTLDDAEAAVRPDAPHPRRHLLVVEILDARTTRCGDIVVKSKSDPLFSMARRLIEEGFDPETIVRFVWAPTGTQSLRDAPLRALAQWTVEETDRGIRFRRHRPSRLWGVTGGSGSEGASAI
jgi:hypothetical protein